MRELWRRLWHGRQLERGLDEEIRFHIDQQTEKNLRAGMSADEARRQAFVKFGGVEHLKERTRDEYRPALLEDFLRDVRYGVRLLFRTKAFAIVAILTLGLGIGAATAVFSVVAACCSGRCPTPIPIASSASIRSTATAGEPTRCRNRTSRTGSPARAASARWRRCRPARAP